MADVIRCNQARTVVASSDDWQVFDAFIANLIKAGAVYKASGDGTAAGGGSKDTTGAIASYLLKSLTAVQNATGPTIAAVTNGGLATITGLSGLVVPTSTNGGGSEGNFLVFTGFSTSANNGTFPIAEVVSTTACRIYNAAAVQADANNGSGSVTWAEKNIVGVAYNSATWSSKSPWVVLETYRMIKVPITSAISLTRGEKVTQGSGATLCEGEFQGSVFDTVGVTGWAVIKPRDRNTWATTLITGATSGNTFTPSATPRVFVTELVIQKSASNYSDGSIYLCCLDNDVAVDGHNLFSYLATQGACTSTVPPGGTASGGNASMPTVAGVACLRGTASVVVGATWAVHASQVHQAIMGNAPPASTATNFDLLIPNNFGTPTSPSVTGAAATSGRTPDGSWTIVEYSTTPNPYGMSYQVMDDAEPGDVCPFAFNSINGDSGSGFDRFAAGSTNATWNGSALVSTNSSAYWRCFTARGCGVAARDLVVTLYYDHSVSQNFFASTYGVVPREANHPATTPPFKTAGFFLMQEGAFNTAGNAPVVMTKTLKGRPRWWRLNPIGGSLATYDSKKWLGIQQGSTSQPGIMIGPWDQSTVPAAS